MGKAEIPRYKKGDLVLITKTVSSIWLGQVAEVIGVSTLDKFNKFEGKVEYELVLVNDRTKERIFFEDWLAPATAISVFLYA